jgi:chaperone required for assembly of F1-ATPase
MKRTYREARAERRDIRLDGAPLTTHAGNPLTAPSDALAVAIADEWNRQGERVDLASIPLTRLAMIAVDRGPTDADAWRASLLAYLRSDLLCYRARGPAGLAARQREHWDPLLAWAAERLGIALQTGLGVAYVDQPPESIAAAARLLDDAAPPELSAMKAAAEIAGSAIIALALARGAFPPERLFAASRVDEAYQEERWGVDPEAQARTIRLRDEFLAIARFLELIR